MSKCYHINGYAITTVDRSVKVILNDLTIRMGAATKIQNIDDVEGIPKCYFIFGKYSDIKDMSRGEEKIIGSYIFFYSITVTYIIHNNILNVCRLHWSFGIN